MSASRRSRWGMLLGLLTALAGPAQAATVVKYVHTDALGSVVAVTDAARTVIEQRKYEPYGQQLPGMQAGPGYTGHVQDVGTGLVYMQQRYYDPFLGRFVSVDPVTALTNGDMRHFNRYAYAYNSPYSFKDPDGRDPGCGSRIEDHAAPACKSHYPSAGDGGGGGGGGGRDGSEVVNDYNDLPKLPPGVTWDEGWSGETWERVERSTGNQEIRWYEPDDGVKQVLPLQLIASMLSNRMLAKVIVPNIEYATQSGLNHLEIQVGYRHVFSRIEHGVFEPNREIYGGYGIIWTNQTIWKPDLNGLDKPERKLWIQAEF